MLDRAENIDLLRADGGAAKHQWLDRGVDPHEQPSVLEPSREVTAVLSRSRRLDPASLESHERPDQIERLSEVAVELPRIAPPYPADAIGVDSRLEQPHAAVDRRLPGPDHREPIRRLGEIDKVVRRDEPDARLDRESGNVTRRDLRLDVARVHESAPRLDDGLGAVEQRDDEVAVPVSAAVLAQVEEPHPARRQEVLVQHTRVVVTDLGRTRTLVEPRVRPVLVDSVVPERPRFDAVVRGGLVKADERISIQPVTARPVTPVDQHDLGVRVRDQRVGEGHPRGTGSDNHVVGLDFAHAPKATASRRVPGPAIPKLRA